MHCLSCSDRPPLVWNGSAGSQISPPKNAKVNCKGCGYSFGPDLSKKKLWGCAACHQYVVCSNCKLCSNGHQLFKCYSLQQKGSPGTIYRMNAYTCDVCSLQVTVPETPPQNFVWHCNPCQYDVCPRHFDQQAACFRPFEAEGAATGQPPFFAPTAPEASPSPKLPVPAKFAIGPSFSVQHLMPKQPLSSLPVWKGNQNSGLFSSDWKHSIGAEVTEQSYKFNMDKVAIFPSKLAKMNSEEYMDDAD